MSRRDGYDKAESKYLDEQAEQVLKDHHGSIIMKELQISKRVFIGIPATGDVRYEWVLARYGQVIPCNWSQQEYIQWIQTTSPMRFMVADARNVVVAEFLKADYEWLIFIDQDVVLPALFLVHVNERIIKKDVPVFSGLYFTKSVPSEPLVYRGRGNGYYANWKIGDDVWVDGLPMGCTVIHRSILELMWNESPEYTAAGVLVRKVFDTPQRVFYNPESRSFNSQTGTEDLEWCSRVMQDGIFRRAGWPKMARKKYPFLIDTRLFCYHIDTRGIRFPSRGEHGNFLRREKGGGK